jgi:hypothetical protein
LHLARKAFLQKKINWVINPDFRVCRAGMRGGFDLMGGDYKQKRINSRNSIDLEQ